MNQTDSITDAPESSEKKRLDGFSLKIIACASMVADHTAKFLHAKGIAEIIFSGLIGRMAFPLFCFLLSEGFFHTHNVKKYIARIFIFAVLSEIPFNLMYGCWFFPEHQNTLFTLGTGLLLFCLLDVIRKKPLLAVRSAVLQIASIAGFAVLSWLLKFDYGFMGILCLACFYYFNGAMMKKRIDACFWGCLMLNLDLFSEIGAFLAMIPVSLYSGKRGRATTARGKLAFYIFYPAHLLILAALTLLP
ncbi:MAG: TraX family protein [Eubacteriales bacterium]|jgi:hypothetical protein